MSLSTRPKLPVFRTIAEAYRSIFDQPALFGRAMAGWAMVPPLLSISIGWLIDLTWPSDVDAATARALAIVVAAFMTFSTLFCGFAFAVAWHRIILLGEAPQGLLPGDLGRTLRYGWQTVATTGVAAIVLAALLSQTWFMAPQFELAETSERVLPIALYIVLVTLLVGLALGRLWLVLPAAAVDERRMTLAVAWKLTKGNSWRIWAGLALADLPVALFVGATYAALGRTGIPVIGHYIEIVGFSFLLMLNVAVGVGFLSHAYRHFVEGPRTGAEPLAAE